MRRLTLISIFVFAVLNLGFARAQTQLGERMFFGPSASALRDLGFLYAVMLQLQDSGKACTLGPADITPVIKKALEALAEVKGSELTNVGTATGRK